jgi:hypothetical protein
VRGLGKAIGGALILAIVLVLVVRSIGVKASAPAIHVAVKGTVSADVADTRAIVQAAKKPCHRSLPRLERLLGYRRSREVPIIRTEPSGIARTVLVDCRTWAIRSPSA